LTINIAVDTRPLSITITGIGRYLQQLLIKMIPASEGKVQWFLYSDQEISFPYEFKNLTRRCRKVKEDKPNNSLLSSIRSTLTSQLLYPQWCKEDNIDVFWGARHQLPLTLPKHITKVLTIHDLVWKKYPKTMSRAGLFTEKLLMPPAIRRADHIICISKSTQDTINEFYPEQISKTEVIYGGVNKSTINEVLARPLNTPYFLFVGTLEPRKNLKRLLKAFSNATKHGGCKHKLVLAGSKGWGDQNVETLIHELNIDTETIVTGYISDMGLQSYYQHADALLMPSLYEGFGLPILEASQYGVPCLTSNCSSMPEVSGKGGILVEPKNTASIEKALCELSSNTELREELSNYAQKQSNAFSWERSAQATLSTLLNSRTEQPIP